MTGAAARTDASIAAAWRRLLSTRIQRHIAHWALRELRRDREAGIFAIVHSAIHLAVSTITFFCPVEAGAERQTAVELARVFGERLEVGYLARNSGDTVDPVIDATEDRPEA